MKVKKWGELCISGEKITYFGASSHIPFLGPIFIFATDVTEKTEFLGKGNREKL